MSSVPEPPYLPEGCKLDYVPRGYDPHTEQAWGISQLSQCQKVRTGCVIVQHGAVVGAGNNNIENPPRVCPRLTLATGTGYELCAPCKQQGHAEIVALENAHERAESVVLEGAVAYLYGHYWVCAPCWAKLREAGITQVFIVVD